MRSFLLPTILFIWYGSFLSVECGDGNLYASQIQTQHDLRFTNYPKLDTQPKLKDETANFDKIIESKLKLSDEAKNSVFRLNYMFTVGCDGSIKDIQPLGDPKMSTWTNIEEIISETDGMWIPALKDGQPVDCIYFGKKTIVGSKY